MQLIDPQFHICIDDLLCPKDHKDVVDHMALDKYWRHSWHSSKKSDPTQWHWHRSLWEDKKGLPGIGLTQLKAKGVDGAIITLWSVIDNALKSKTGLPWNPIRAYCNAHTYGLDGALHTDDGTLTVIYYPEMDWDPAWQGGTGLFYKAGTSCLAYYPYVSNRLVALNSKIWHMAMPLAKSCIRLRTVIVFKCEVDVDDPLYEEWYDGSERWHRNNAKPIPGSHWNHDPS